MATWATMVSQSIDNVLFSFPGSTGLGGPYRVGNPSKNDGQPPL